MRSSRSPLYYKGDKIMEKEKGEINDFKSEISINSSSNRANMMRSDANAAKRAVAGPKRMVAAEKSSKASEDINESAEAFIRKFRQQLVIQRLESIENFESMLARGT